MAGASTIAAVATKAAAAMNANVVRLTLLLISDHQHYAQSVSLSRKRLLRFDPSDSGRMSADAQAP